jgi:hypothetical protein
LSKNDSLDNYRVRAVFDCIIGMFLSELTAILSAILPLLHSTCAANRQD